MDCRDCKAREILVSKEIYNCHDFCRVYQGNKEKLMRANANRRKESTYHYMSFRSERATLGQMANM